MAQQPSSGVPHDALKRYRALNDQHDSLKRPQGTFPDSRNLWDGDQADSASRRPGRSFESLSGDGIMLLFPFVWDDGSAMQIEIAGTTASHEAATYPPRGDISDQQDDPAVPGPMPNEPQFLPFFKPKAFSSIPDYASLFRALGEAREYVNNGTDDLTYPTRAWELDFMDSEDNTVASACTNKQQILSLLAKGYYPVRKKSASPVTPTSGSEITNDFYFVDYLCQSPRIHTDLDVETSPQQPSVRSLWNSVKNSYVKTYPIEGSSSVDNYSGADDVAGLTYNSAIESPVNLRLYQWVDRVNKLKRVKVSARQTDQQYKYASLEGYNCDLAKSNTYNDWDSASWSFPPWHYALCQMREFSTSYPNYSALIVTTRVKFTADLTNRTGDATLYLKVGNVGANYERSNAGPVINDDKYHAFDTPETGEVWTSDYVGESRPTFTKNCPLSTPYGTSWIVNEHIVVIERDVTNFASTGNESGFGSIILPDEYFLIEEETTTTGELSLSWGSVKRAPSDGAADPSYPLPTATGEAVAITPSTSVNYSASAGGFSKSRFKEYYRPCILLSLELNTTNSDTSATSTVKLYINATLVSTITGVPAAGGKLRWAFSILDVGDYGTARPPQNDPNNSLKGWPAPSVRVTVTPSSGNLSINSTTKLLDYVVNYPAG